MTAWLTQPVDTMHFARSVEASESSIDLVTASMQGWRTKPEDEATTFIQTDSDVPKRECAIYTAVFDGHGGAGAARYAKDRLNQWTPFGRSLTANPAHLVSTFLNLDAEICSREKEISHTGCTAVVSCIQPCYGTLDVYFHLMFKPFFACAGASEDKKEEKEEKEREGEGEGETKSPKRAKTEKTSEKKRRPTWFRITIAHAGDSVAMVIDPAGTILYRTRDHQPKLADETKRIEAAGHFVGRNDRLNGNLSVSRGFGNRFYKVPRADGPPLSPATQPFCALPEVHQFLAPPGSWVLVFSDGISGKITDHELVSMAMSGPSSFEPGDEASPVTPPPPEAHALCRSILELALEKGSKDNMTITAAFLGCSFSSSSPPPPLLSSHWTLLGRNTSSLLPGPHEPTPLASIASSIASGASALPTAHQLGCKKSEFFDAWIADLAQIKPFPSLSKLSAAIRAPKPTLLLWS